MSLTFATYNILHGYYAKQIEENIKFLKAQGASIICVQEAELPLENYLGENWKVEYFHLEEPGCHLAIAWDSSAVKLLETDTFLLPALDKPAFRQKFTAYRNTKIQRGALLATFKLGGKTIRVTNAHLAWEGGASNRFRQLSAILEKHKTQENFEYEILAGDFNTAVPALFRSPEEKKWAKLLGKEWQNVLPNLTWTCDLSHTDPQDGYETIAKICKKLGIKGRVRLDYIFSKNLKVKSAEMFDLGGSDHRPLLATFEYK